MKEFLRKIIHPSLWDFIRYIKFKFFKFGYFAPYQLDKKLKKYLNYDYGFFVELGANDGYTESNTLFLENKRNWRGILIEPSPQQFLSCCYYRSKPGNKLFCNACVPFDYKKESYRWWYLMPDDFIGENSGNIAEGENFIWESVVMPEENGEGAKMKSVEDLSLRKTNEDPVTIEMQMLRKDEIIWVAEDTLTWASELPKEGDFESNIAGKAISIEVKEGTKKIVCFLILVRTEF